MGVDPSTFGFHSLRLGGAPSAANNGVSERVYERHGLWKSVEAEDTYVDEVSWALRNLHLLFCPILCHSICFARLVLAKPSLN